MRSAKPVTFKVPAIFGEIDLRVTVSTKIKSNRPPSRAGKGIIFIMERSNGHETLETNIFWI